MNPLHKKYPKTFHLPYSPGTTRDDKKLKDDSHLLNKEVVIKLKVDGENCNLTNDRNWARSVDSKDHPSRNWIQQFWEVLRYDIPDNMRICGENLYATHSIHYTALPSYFLCFAIYENDICLSWDETKEWCSLLGLEMVPELYRGIYSKEKIIELASSPFDILGGTREGIVGRFPGRFHYDDFSENVFKWVRKGHVQTDEHWMNKPVVPNKLKG